MTICGERKWEWQRPCPICGSDAPELIYRNRMAAIGDFDMSYEVGRCHNCGFHYAFQLPRAETYSRYYRDLSKYDLPTSVEQLSSLDRVRTEVAVRICRPHVPPDTGVADLGCGVGALLHAFGMAGYTQLFGLDPSPGAPTRAREAFGLKYAKNGFLLDAPKLLPLGHVGLVCLTGVLEHLPNLRDDLQRLIECLSYSAKILIEVPAVERFLRRNAEPYGEFSLEHVQYFSRSSLVNLMACLGYVPLVTDIVELDGATDSLFGLFARGHSAALAVAEPDDLVNLYLTRSGQEWSIALERVATQTQSPFIIYGAGSHSARLLPALETHGLLDRVIGIVDGNRNLQGKHMAGHIIQDPERLQEDPSMTVLVSSHKSQTAIARSLGNQRPLILMY